MPMICPKCQQEIPDKVPWKKHGAPALVCPRCLAAKSYQQILDFQKPFLDRIRKGDIQLSFRKRADGPQWHIAFLQYRDQAWCGEPIESGWKGKQHLPWAKAPAATCDRCREVIEQMLEGKTAEVA